MKKKILLSSILTIALCICIIAGSTFALFTDDSQFNIAVTAGKVDVEASASIAAVWSAEGAEIAEDEFLVDENAFNYTHVKQADNKTFANGGVAVIEGTSLKISRITPGDKVDVNIDVANRSDVAISYRYKIAVSKDEGLADGMVLSLLEDAQVEKDELTFAVESYEGFESYISEWYFAEAPDGDAEEILSRMISVELPVYAGNEYQEKSVEYTILVEAVQANAVTTNDSIVTIYTTAMQRNIARGGDVNGKGVIVDMDDSMSIVADTTLSNMTLNGTSDVDYAVLFALGTEAYDIVMGDGATINVAGDDQRAFWLMHRCHSLTLKEGSKINVTGDNSYGIYVYEIDSTGTADLYIEAAGLIEVTGENSCAIYVTDSYVVLNIHVPTVEVMDYYKSLTVNDGATINWYVAGELVTE